jgi:hypothetical protein
MVELAQTNAGAAWRAIMAVMAVKIKRRGVATGITLAGIKAGIREGIITAFFNPPGRAKTQASFSKKRQNLKAFGLAWARIELRSGAATTSPSQPRWVRPIPFQKNSSTLPA